jgi:hypothetical protein
MGYELERQLSDRNETASRPGHRNVFPERMAESCARVDGIDLRGNAHRRASLKQVISLKEDE